MTVPSSTITSNQQYLRLSSPYVFQVRTSHVVDKIFVCITNTLKKKTCEYIILKRFSWYCGPGHSIPSVSKSSQYHRYCLIWHLTFTDLNLTHLHPRGQDLPFHMWTVKTWTAGTLELILLLFSYCISFLSLPGIHRNWRGYFIVRIWT